MKAAAHARAEAMMMRTSGLGGERGSGVPGYGVPGCGKHGVWWTTRGVENPASSGKHEVWWKTRGLSGKHGV